MDISNRTLAVFLLAAIVVSLGGTIVSLNRLNSITGYAGSAFGNVSLSVGGTLSITTVDNPLLNFGSCSPISGFQSIINSVGGANTTTVCAAYSVDNISVRNDGNVHANVTISANRTGAAHGGDFLNSVTGVSAFAYRTTKNGYAPYTNGCVGDVSLATYANFTSTVANYTACSNLTAGGTNNSFITDFQIVVPYDAPQGQSDVMITYRAFNG